MPRFEVVSPDGKKYEVNGPDGSTHQDAIAYIQTQLSDKPKMQNLPTMADSMKEELASRGPLERGLAGVGSFVDNAAMRLKQLTGNTLTPAETGNVQANRQIASDPAGMAGNIAGSVAATGYPGAALFRGVANAAGRVLPRVLSGTAGGAVSGGTVATATQPVLSGESEAGNTSGGAIGGALGDAGARVLGRVAQPIIQSPAVARLLGQGIVPTPGQAAGGIINSLEQKAQSLPITGEILGAARARPRVEFNKAELNLGVPEGKVSQAGNAGLDEVKGALSSAYDKVFAGHVVTPTKQLFSAIDAAKQTPTLPLNQASQGTFDSVIKNVFAQRVPANGQISAEDTKAKIIGDIGRQARAFQNSPDAYQKALGDALMEARNVVQKWLVAEVSRASPDAAKQIAKIDPAYAARIMTGKAVERAAAQGGVFTPYQAIKTSRPGTPTRALAEDAQSVLGNTVPDSGTAGRGLAAFMFAHPSSVVNPAEYAGIPLASLLYSRPGSRYMLGDLPGQEATARALRASAPAVSQASMAGFLAQRKRTTE